jgi:hypothetical protein
MKAHLLYPDRDVDLQAPLPWNADALTRDLALDMLFKAMARGDEIVLDVAKKVILSGFDGDLETIRYRQGILRDCLNHPAVFRELYAVAAEAMEKEKKHYLGSLIRYPEWVLRHSIKLSEMFIDMLQELQKIANSHADKVASEGCSALFAMLQRELSDEFFVRARRHLQELTFRRGLLLSARLGRGNKGTRYVLRQRSQRGRGWLTRLFGPRPPAFSFSLHPRDEAGARALGELRDRGLALVADALAQSTDHLRSFFRMLRTELAFYIGCVNLYEQLARKGEPVCFPSPAATTEGRLSFRGLYEVCLALSVGERVVGNTVDADRGGPRDRHRRQSGRQIEVSAKRRLGSADDAMWNVCAGRSVLCQRPRWRGYSFQARRGCQHEEGKARRGT